MAFEVFDDVAFFYMLTSIFAMFVLPWTGAKILSLILSHQSKIKQEKEIASLKTPHSLSTSEIPCNCAKCQEKRRMITNRKKSLKQYLTFSNILFAILWIIFLILLSSISSYKHTELVSFKPHELLGLTTGETYSESQIKSAYRKKSLQYHPDKNPDNEEAAQKFIMIQKAYKTLTDPAAKENIEKYGNPDGYQGVSVTIGLPSVLTKKEHSIRILFIYFLLFIVLPPFGVFLWWRKAKKYTESGVQRKSLEAFYFCLTSQMTSRYLIEVLSLAGEYEILQQQPLNSELSKFSLKQQQKDFAELYAAIKDSMVKQRFYDPTFKRYGHKFDYVHIASVLIHAYLKRVTIPESLQPALELVLKDAHMLLNAMLEASIRRGFIKTTFGCIDLMQLISQAMWSFDSPLIQLPHMNDNFVRKLSKKNVKTLSQFKRAPLEKKQKCVPELTDSQWKDMDQVLNLLPLDVEMSHKVEVEGEEGIYEGDIILVEVTLERIEFDPYRAEGEQRKKLSTEEADEENSEDNEEKKDSALGDGVESSEKQALTGAKSKAGYIDTDMTDDELLDNIPIPSTNRFNVFADSQPPLAHCVYFPFEKREKWVVFLVENRKKGPIVVGMQKVPNFISKQTVQMRFPAPKAMFAQVNTEDGAIHEYQLHAMCDSYVGCDQLITFKVKVSKPKSKKATKAENDVSNIVEEGDEEEWEEAHGHAHGKRKKSPLLIDDDENENYDGKWYYLYFESFFEMILNLFVLGLLCVFIFNFLVSRGYWQRYIQPSIDFIGYYVSPVWLGVRPYVAPVLDPLLLHSAAAYTWLSNVLHREDTTPRVRKKGTPRGGKEELRPEDEIPKETNEEEIKGMGEEEPETEINAETKDVYVETE